MRGAGPNDSVRRQAIHQEPCRTLDNSFSEWIVPISVPFFFLYIRRHWRSAPAVGCGTCSWVADGELVGLDLGAAHTELARRAHRLHDAA